MRSPSSSSLITRPRRGVSALVRARSNAERWKGGALLVSPLPSRHMPGFPGLRGIFPGIPGARALAIDSRRSAAKCTAVRRLVTQLDFKDSVIGRSPGTRPDRGQPAAGRFVTCNCAASCGFIDPAYAMRSTDQSSARRESAECKRVAWVSDDGRLDVLVPDQLRYDPHHVGGVSLGGVHRAAMDGPASATARFWIQPTALPVSELHALHSAEEDLLGRFARPNSSSPSETSARD
jgi:hypothetical protein